MSASQPNLPDDMSAILTKFVSKRFQVAEKLTQTPVPKVATWFYTHLQDT
jgi:hypothetical protein